MQAEEGKGASSRQRAAAAASTRAVGSPVRREPRRPRQEVRRAATCAGEEVRGGRGGGGKEGGRGRPDLSGKGAAGAPRSGGRRPRRGGSNRWRRQPRKGSSPRVEEGREAAAGGRICRGRGWRGPRGRPDSPRPQVAPPSSDPVAASRSTRRGSSERGSRWCGGAPRASGSAAAGLKLPSELRRASGPRRRRVCGSPGPPSFASRKPRQRRPAPPCSIRPLAGALTGRKRGCSPCAGTEEAIQGAAVQGRRKGRQRRASVRGG
jgi:hypothetical protein